MVSIVTTAIVSKLSGDLTGTSRKYEVIYNVRVQNLLLLYSANMFLIIYQILSGASVKLLKVKRSKYFYHFSFCLKSTRSMGTEQ